jgi:predicted PolB exonuclease-like 3'-5' exonuclease
MAKKIKIGGEKMIIGNPYEFALQFDTVAAWNDCGGGFDNGVMHYSKRLPVDVMRALGVKP